MFPFKSEISISPHLQVDHALILDRIGPLLTAARRDRIDQVVQQRNFMNAVVLESIYDRGNISAVMRSAEAFGFVNFHVIETQEKFKEANRVTQGADKWVEVTKWKSSAETIRNLKAQGFKLVVTTLEASKPIGEIDFNRPTALVLGNEKEGVSREMLDAADERIIIPMNGFVQSFNISVAGALCMYHTYLHRQRTLGSSGHLSEEQKNILRALYYLRTQDSAVDVLQRVLEEGRA